MQKMSFYMKSILIALTFFLSSNGFANGKLSCQSFFKSEIKINLEELTHQESLYKAIEVEADIYMFLEAIRKKPTEQMAFKWGEIKSQLFARTDIAEAGEKYIPVNEDVFIRQLTAVEITYIQKYYNHPGFDLKRAMHWLVDEFLEVENARPEMLAIYLDMLKAIPADTLVSHYGPNEFKSRVVKRTYETVDEFTELTDKMMSQLELVPIESEAFLHTSNELLRTHTQNKQLFISAMKQMETEIQRKESPEYQRFLYLFYSLNRTQMLLSALGIQELMLFTPSSSVDNTTSKTLH